MRNLVFLFLSIFAGTAPCIAQQTIELMMKDSSSQAYLLDESARITFVRNSIILSTSATSEEIALGNVESYHFSDGFTMINSGHMEGEYLKKVNDKLLCRVNGKNEELRLWNDAGQLVLYHQLSANLENVISLETLPHGIYLAKVKDFSVKIIL